MNIENILLNIAIKISVLLIILSTFYIIFINSFGNATSGEHTGIITVVEENDRLFWWNNKIIYFKSSDESTQEDKYCILPNLVDKAKELSTSKSIVTIKFANDYLVWNKECNGGITIVYELVY